MNKRHEAFVGGHGNIHVGEEDNDNLDPYTRALETQNVLKNQIIEQLQNQLLEPCSNCGQRRND